MTGREFREAKSYHQGQLALDWEETSHIAAHLASDYLFETPVIGSKLSVHKANSNILKNLRISHIRSFRFLSAAISKVTPDQVESLARQLFSHLDKNLYLAAIGPLNADLKYLKSLK